MQTTPISPATQLSSANLYLLISNIYPTRRTRWLTWPTLRGDGLAQSRQRALRAWILTLQSGIRSRGLVLSSVSGRASHSASHSSILAIGCGGDALITQMQSGHIMADKYISLPRCLSVYDG